MRQVLFAALTAGSVLAATRAPAHAEPKSLRRAQLYSGAGTIVSGGLFLASFLTHEKNGEVNMPLLYTGLGSMVITPSLGDWYAHHWLTPGMAIRVASSVLAVYAVREYTIDVRCNTAEFDTSCKSLEGEAVALLGVAAIAFVGGAAYDIKQLPETVGDYNRRNGYTLTPILVPPTSASGGAAGLGLAGTF